MDTPFITVLADGFLVPASDRPHANYVVWGRSAGQDICDVPRQVGEAAIANPDVATFLGTWPATFRGVTDEWRIWYGIGVPWASNRTVIDSANAAQLMAEFSRLAAEAERAGTVHNPDPSLLPESAYEPMM